MSPQSHTNKLFNESGCLSTYALAQYERNALSKDDLLAVKQHLDGCPLCSDAVEGMSLLNTGGNDYVSDPNQTYQIDPEYIPAVTHALRDEHGYGEEKQKRIFFLNRSFQGADEISNSTDSINRKLRDKFGYRPMVPRSKKRRLSATRIWIPAAASVIIIAGLVAYFQYFSPGKQELAVADMPEEQVQQPKGETLPVLIPDTGKSSINGKSEKAGPPAEKMSENIQDTGPVINKGQEKEISEADNAVADEKITVGGVFADEEKAREAPAMAMAEKKMGERQAMPAFTDVDQMPEFPGGKDSLDMFISKNLIYPPADEAVVNKSVLLTFLIDEKGMISEINVLKGDGIAYQQEAIRLLEKMPPWLPGRQDGKAVRV
ncbi:MAG TPA: hypothetical protein VK994_07490, partial [Bacteroidales bacterium]|nr:hypothetical protein [Bacteroidales bacterium]